MRIVYSKKFLFHFSPFEKGERIEVIKEYLDEHIKPKYFPPARVKEKELLCVHSQELLDGERRLCAMGPASVGDNYFQHNTLEIAMLAAGAALKAATMCLKGDGFAFSMARPPGHHAGRRYFGGFCYLNNIAFAVRSMQMNRGIKRVLIVDFDLHYGNGTRDIFGNDETVYYLSFHQNPEHTYPFTGFEAESDAHTRNIVVQDGVTDGQYLRLFEREFCKSLCEFNPEMVAVSAGFDIFSKDSGVGNRLAVKKPETFNAIGRAIRENFRGPIFAVLEGGYYLPALGRNVYNFLSAFE
jgi:acetoin utilization deacetylase AcuC-like enzyme